MQRAAASRSRDVPQSPADMLARLRAQAPRVHCITNSVAQNFTANVLLAAGAMPSMTLAPRKSARSSRAPMRCWSISARSTRERREATALAIDAAPTSGACPGCSIRCSSTARRPRADFRRDAARRGSPARCGSTRPNSLRCRRRAGPKRALARFARPAQRVVALIRRHRPHHRRRARCAIENGHPLMARVTAMGCAASALVAACLAVEADAFARPPPALLTFGVAGEHRGGARAGPGSFAAAMLDALSTRLDWHDAASQKRG